MQITINLDTDSGADLLALAALVASLSGRSAVIHQDVRVAQTEPTDTRTARDTASVDRPPVPTSAGEFAPAVSSEALLQQEANRAAGNPTGQSSAGTAPPAFDSSGLPWDERIHGKSGDGTLPTNADGTWRKRRGVDDATVAAVTAELRAALGNGQAPDAPPAAGQPSTPVVTASVTEAPAPPATPAAPTDGARFANFAEFVTAVNTKGLTYAALNELSAASFQVPEFRNMKDHPQHWDMFALLAGVE